MTIHLQWKSFFAQSFMQNISYPPWNGIYMRVEIKKAASIINFIYLVGYILVHRFEFLRLNQYQYLPFVWTKPSVQVEQETRQAPPLPHYHEVYVGNLNLSVYYKCMKVLLDNPRTKALVEYWISTTRRVVRNYSLFVPSSLIQHSIIILLCVMRYLLALCVFVNKFRFIVRLHRNILCIHTAKERYTYAGYM